MSVPPERLLKIVCSSFRKPEMLSAIRTDKSALRQKSRGTAS